MSIYDLKFKCLKNKYTFYDFITIIFFYKTRYININKFSIFVRLRYSITEKKKKKIYCQKIDKHF